MFQELWNLQFEVRSYRQDSLIESVKRFINTDISEIETLDLEYVKEKVFYETLFIKKNFNIVSHRLLETKLRWNS